MLAGMPAPGRFGQAAAADTVVQQNMSIYQAKQLSRPPIRKSRTSGRARGFQAAETPFESYAQMVQSYVDGIRAVQPHGPYALCGYSYGGVVAFEIGKALERAGERVAFLGAINVPPHISEIRKQIDLFDTAANLAFLLSLIGKEQVVPLAAELRRAPSEDAAFAEILRRSPAQRLRELDLSPERFATWSRVAFGLVKLARSYEPSGLIQRMTVFYTSPPVIYGSLGKAAWYRDQLRQWDELSREVPRYLELHGEHQSLLSQRIDEFQAVLRSELASQLEAS